MTTSSTFSILIPTYNRAAVLKETLEACCRLDLRGLKATWIIIDNNSDDGTPAVVASFVDRLEIISLFEPSPGKNCALNKALNECLLNEIVVFADDDITPERDWLQQIAAACRKHPACDVFGGRIEIQWPGNTEPKWARDRYIQEFGYSFHNYGTESINYPPNHYPFGPNFWVRRTVFEQGYRFDTRVGPRPKNRIMGSETTFLHMLAKNNYHMRYCPQARVLHRIALKACTPAMVRRRAFRLGRADAYVIGIPRPKLRASSKLIWHTFLVGKLVNACLRNLTALLQPSQEKRLLRSVQAYRVIGHTFEAWRLDDANPHIS